MLSYILYTFREIHFKTMHNNNKAYQRHKRLIDNWNRMMNSPLSSEINENSTRGQDFNRNIFWEVLEELSCTTICHAISDHEIKHQCLNLTIYVYIPSVEGTCSVCSPIWLIIYYLIRNMYNTKSPGGTNNNASIFYNVWPFLVFQTRCHIVLKIYMNDKCRWCIFVILKIRLKL